MDPEFDAFAWAVMAEGVKVSNITFGRRFQIQSFRWLAPDEV